MDKELAQPYHCRTAEKKDAADVAVLLNLCTREVIGVEQDSEERLLFSWSHSDFHVETDTRLVLDANENIVGFVELWDVSHTHVRLWTKGRVHPAHRGKGIGSWLAAWVEERARQQAEKAPASARVGLVQILPGEQPEAARLMEQAGFHWIRTSWQMTYEMKSAPQVPDLPEGVEIRTMQPGEERAVIWTVRQAFLDHWGFVDEPFEEEYQSWMVRIQADKEFDPSLWLTARQQGEVIGICLCFAKINEDPGSGFVDALGVLREWRGRGLGTALLQSAFAELYQRGTMRVGLNVDSSNLTGAQRIYERAGMTTLHADRWYEKEIRPGVELTTQTL